MSEFEFPFPVLVCDIGGTNVRFSLSAAPDAPLGEAVHRQTWDFPGLGEAIEAAVPELGARPRAELRNRRLDRLAEAGKIPGLAVDGLAKRRVGGGAQRETDVGAANIADQHRKRKFELAHVRIIEEEARASRLPVKIRAARRASLRAMAPRRALERPLLENDPSCRGGGGALPLRGNRLASGDTGGMLHVATPRAVDAPPGRRREMAHWLFKSEPSAWSFDMLVAAGEKGTDWSGIRNHSAKLNMMAMKTGERGFFYHSNEGKV